jgi:hypothetical protein
LTLIGLGTIRAPVVAGYLFWVILIGTLLQWRGVVMATVASSLAVLGLIVAENAGLLPQPNYSVYLKVYSNPTYAAYHRHNWI